MRYRHGSRRFIHIRGGGRALTLARSSHPFRLPWSSRSMSQLSTPLASTSGILLTRVGLAGCALRWDAQAACWRWTDPQGGQLYAWPAQDSTPVGVRLLESAGVIAC